MATIITLWAGSTSSTSSDWTILGNRLPSPVSVEITREEIWNADAGRNSKGTMIATYIAQKRTWNIKWGVLDNTDFEKITGLLTTGFFKFEQTTNDTTPPSSTYTAYRSEITYSLLQVGTTRYYKDVSVSVIQK